ncbi:nucleotidyltransferase family protein [Komagataeibacter sp. FNDCR2]|uniref:nucleotidyltransferase family protein n=1 Tax=Komagataeibacter sp. FNDCR2 TaxID=2878682 RepID=UPI001E58D282|nr:nucleotidyltransferase family protein [Komagataeibacter sp. FNDCR2]MCE2576112.1 nucleotidyltransferase family protein [Komagataeibacter sp. FNDCR2]
MSGTPSRIAAIVLAAGTSSRTAPLHKLLAPDATGLPMIARTLRAVTASRADPVTVVLGHRAGEIHEAALPGVQAGRTVSFITAPDYVAGLSQTLAAGIQALGPRHDVAGALICLGDMPLIGTDLINRLIAAFMARPDRPGALPMLGGRWGNPIIWNRALFPALMALRGDQGARGLVLQHQSAMLRIPAGPEITQDFDTPARLAEFARLFTGG